MRDSFHYLIASTWILHQRSFKAFELLSIAETRVNPSLILLADYFERSASLLPLRLLLPIRTVQDYLLLLVLQDHVLEDSSLTRLAVYARRTILRSQGELGARGLLSLLKESLA